MISVECEEFNRWPVENACPIVKKSMIIEPFRLVTLISRLSAVPSYLIDKIAYGWSWPFFFVFALVNVGSIKTKQWWQTYHSWEILSGHRHRMNEGDIFSWLLIHAVVVLIITTIDPFQHWWAIVYAMHKWKRRIEKVTSIVRQFAMF